MNDGTDERDVKFLSKDIQTDKMEYFTKTRKRFDIKVFFRRLGESPLFRGKRKFITIGCGALVLVAVIVGPVVIFNALNNRQSDTVVEESAFDKAMRVQSEAMVVFESDGAKAGIDKFQEYIDSAGSDEEKSALHLRRAASLFSLYGEAMSEEIFDDAYAAEELYPTANTALTICIYEGYWGSQEVADRYHDLAVERDPDMAGSGVEAPDEG